MTLRIVFHEERCTLCHLCSLWCSVTFSEKGIYTFQPSRARIRVAADAEDERYVAHVCLQCDHPACVPACPEEALSKDPDTGVVCIDEELCIGCGMCEEACPFGGIFLVGEKAVKCEVCDDPLCVQACAMKALELQDVEEGDMVGQARLYREVRL